MCYVLLKGMTFLLTWIFNQHQYLTIKVLIETSAHYCINMHNAESSLLLEFNMNMSWSVQVQSPSWAFAKFGVKDILKASSALGFLHPQMYLSFTRHPFGQKIQTFHQFPLKKKKGNSQSKFMWLAELTEGFGGRGGVLGGHIRENVTSHLLPQITFENYHYLRVLSSYLWLLPPGDVGCKPEVTGGQLEMPLP